MEERSVKLNRNSEIRRKRRVKLLFVGMLLVLVLIIAAIGFLRRGSLQITDITVTGAEVTDPHTVHDAAQKFISGNYALVIPRSNAWLFSKRNLQDALANQFPGIAQVTVSLHDRTQMMINIVEKRPTYLWCDATNVCWFVDQTGLVYEQAPNFSDGAFVKFSGNLPDVSAMSADPRGGRFASAADFGSIQDILSQLSNYPISVLGVDYLGANDAIAGADVTGPGDIAIRIDSLQGNSVDSNAVILITQNVSPDSLKQSVDLILSQDAFSTSLKSNGNNLQYIDLRFSGKIYYKFAAPISIKTNVQTKKQP